VSRCRAQRHHGGQSLKLLSEQEGVHLPFDDDQRAAGPDDGEVRIQTPAPASPEGLVFWASPLGLAADVDHPRGESVEPRDSNPRGYPRSPSDDDSQPGGPDG
jgi:hypothetical protein